MVEQANELILDILPLSAQTARLVRVYGTAPCVALPGTLPAPAGGSLALTELGDYCFSEKPRSLPAADALCRYAVSADGTVRLTRAFGQAMGQKPARRYDFDLDAPAADEEELHPVCGSFLEEATLPDSVQVIGSCAFYNCRSLRLLTVGSGGLTVGSDVFLNCFALETLRVQAAPEQPTGLFALVNNITEAVRAEFRPAGAAAKLAPTGRISRRPPPTSCCTPFPGRDTITDSVFSTINSSPQNMTPSSRRGTMPMTPPLWPCSALAACGIRGS